jgi:hypothetical protein
MDGEILDVMDENAKTTPVVALHEMNSEFHTINMA